MSIFRRKIYEWNINLDYFAILLLTIMVLFINYIKRRKKLFLILAILSLLFWIYSFFTYNGSVRLAMAVLMKHSIIAYTSGITDSFAGGNSNKYFSFKGVNDLWNFKTKNYMLIKISTYYGFWYYNNKITISFSPIVILA